MCCKGLILNVLSYFRHIFPANGVRKDNINSSLQLLRSNRGLRPMSGQIGLLPDMQAPSNIKKINWTITRHNTDVLTCFQNLDSKLSQIFEQGVYFGFPICVTTVLGCFLCIFSACCSHALFWTKYILREILRSKSHALLFQWTQHSLLTVGFYFLEQEQES